MPLGAASANSNTARDGTISLISRLTPRISIFYISSPFVLMGGMYLLYLTVASSLTAFDAGVETWMKNGG